MKDLMLGKITRKLGEVPEEYAGTIFDLCEKLCGEDGPNRYSALKSSLLMTSKGAYKALSAPNILFKRTDRIIRVRGSKRPFDVDVFFDSYKSSISFLGSNIKEHLSGLIEENTPSITLLACRLRERAEDDQIVESLGGKDNMLITVGQFAAWIRTRANRDGIVYGGYVLGNDGKPVTILACYLGNRGWEIDARRSQTAWTTNTVFVLPNSGVRFD